MAKSTAVNLLKLLLLLANSLVSTQATNLFDLLAEKKFVYSPKPNDSPDAYEATQISMVDLGDPQSIRKAYIAAGDFFVSKMYENKPIDVALLAYKSLHSQAEYLSKENSNGLFSKIIKSFDEDIFWNRLQEYGVTFPSGTTISTRIAWLKFLRFAKPPEAELLLHNNDLFRGTLSIMNLKLSQLISELRQKGAQADIDVLESIQASLPDSKNADIKKDRNDFFVALKRLKNYYQSEAHSLTLNEHNDASQIGSEINAYFRSYHSDIQKLPTPPLLVADTREAILFARVIEPELHDSIDPLIGDLVRQAVANNSSLGLNISKSSDGEMNDLVLQPRWKNSEGRKFSISFKPSSFATDLRFIKRSIGLRTAIDVSNFDIHVKGVNELGKVSQPIIRNQLAALLSEHIEVNHPLIGALKAETPIEVSVSTNWKLSPEDNHPGILLMNVKLSYLDSILGNQNSEVNLRVSSTEKDISKFLVNNKKWNELFLGELKTLIEKSPTTSCENGKCAPIKKKDRDLEEWNHAFQKLGAEAAEAFRISDMRPGLPEKIKKEFRDYYGRVGRFEIGNLPGVASHLLRGAVSLAVVLSHFGRANIEDMWASELLTIASIYGIGTLAVAIAADWRTQVPRYMGRLVGSVLPTVVIIKCFLSDYRVDALNALSVLAVAWLAAEVPRAANAMIKAALKLKGRIKGEHRPIENFWNEIEKTGIKIPRQVKSVDVRPSIKFLPSFLQRISQKSSLMSPKKNPLPSSSEEKMAPCATAMQSIAETQSAPDSSRKRIRNSVLQGNHR
jgi:hypothetical protein